MIICIATKHGEKDSDQLAKAKERKCINVSKIR